MNPETILCVCRFDGKNLRALLTKSSICFELRKECSSARIFQGTWWIWIFRDSVRHKWSLENEEASIRQNLGPVESGVHACIVVPNFSVTCIWPVFTQLSAVGSEKKCLLCSHMKNWRIDIENLSMFIELFYLFWNMQGTYSFVESIWHTRSWQKWFRLTLYAP